MAIQKITRKKGTVYRVYYRNPHSGKVEFTPVLDKLKDAREMDSAIKHRLEFEPETFLPADFAPPTDTPLLSELLKEYTQHAHMTDVTRKQTFYHVRRVVDFMPSVEVAGLTRARLKEMERAMREAGMKQNTVQRRVSIVLSCLNWCVDEEIIEENPLQGYRCRRGEDLKIIPPTPEEMALIYAQAPPHVRRALTLSWYLGVRPGASELFRLVWEDVDLDNRMIRVWSAKKNKDMVIRELDLVDELATPLAVWKSEDMALGTPWIVHYRGAAISSIKTAWRTMLDNAKITRRIRPYDLRHAFATQALAEGADIKAVSEVMGHNSTAMIHKHYQHVLNRQKKHALASVPKFSTIEETVTPNIVIPTSEEPTKWKN